MQYYEAVDTDNTIAIIFEGEELPLGFKVMEDLLQVMKMSGGKEAPEMQKWLKEAKQKHFPSPNTTLQ